MKDANSAGSPVEPDAGPPQPLSDEPALCLSGGGYRAMSFHLGALWRLDELGVLPRLGRISSVSGGSIVAARLALRWSVLDFGPDGRARRFVEEVVTPVRRLASHTIDVPAVLLGVFPPWTVSGRIAASYRKHLLRKRLAHTLDAPVDRTTALADTPTRLAAVPGDVQERLVNWGYAVCDAALRKHVSEFAARPAGSFPYLRGVA